jgi:hypothetical protein
MALYKHGNHLQHVQDQAFDGIHHPGQAAPFAGIYRCVVCGHEIGTAYGHTLPPQGHHQHSPGLGPIQWQLLVFAQHKP